MEADVAAAPAPDPSQALRDSASKLSMRQNGLADPHNPMQRAADLTLSRAPWIGGQGTLPEEQNTQQSPAFGRSSVPQPVHPQKTWQASVGIASVA